LNSLVSIIIPTYNRAHLIGETLESILAQTYTNWECIVVDDGSTDYTDELLEFYCKKDHRIQFHHRPPNRRKGANACRNYGYELSQGDYIQWFDSDDLMMIENLDVRLNSFDMNTDFVIGDHLEFNKEGLVNHVKKNYNLKITPKDFINFKIFWITNDITLRRRVVKIRFNENLESDQDYNFFCRLLHLTTKGKYLKKYLTLRRMHLTSIQGNLKNSQYPIEERIFQNEYYLLLDIRKSAEEFTINRLLKRLIRFSYNLVNKFSIDQKQVLISRYLYSYNFKAFFYYTLWILSNLFCGKGYFFIKKASNSLNSQRIVFKNDK
jgi:glycosyltransferase involved in cell wall biosynthesis